MLSVLKQTRFNATDLPKRLCEVFRHLHLIHLMSVKWPGSRRPWIFGALLAAARNLSVVRKKCSHECTRSKQASLWIAWRRLWLDFLQVNSKMAIPQRSEN